MVMFCQTLYINLDLTSKYLCYKYQHKTTIFFKVKFSVFNNIFYLQKYKF